MRAQTRPASIVSLAPLWCWGRGREERATKISKSAQPQGEKGMPRERSLVTVVRMLEKLSLYPLEIPPHQFPFMVIRSSERIFEENFRSPRDVFIYY
jgi:hypothetical protein